MHSLNHFQHFCTKISTINRTKNMVTNTENIKFLLNNSTGPEEKWQTSQMTWSVIKYLAKLQSDLHIFNFSRSVLFSADLTWELKGRFVRKNWYLWSCNQIWMWGKLIYSSANMDISAGLEYKLLKCNTPEDAKLFSIKSLDKALQDQIYYKLKIQLWWWSCHVIKYSYM